MLIESIRYNKKQILISESHNDSLILLSMTTCCCWLCVQHTGTNERWSPKAPRRIWLLFSLVTAAWLKARSSRLPMATQLFVWDWWNASVCVCACARYVCVCVLELSSWERGSHRWDQLFQSLLPIIKRSHAISWRIGKSKWVFC